MKRYTSFLLLGLFIVGYFVSYKVRVVVAQKSTKTVINIGVVHDLGTLTGKRSRASISLAIDEFYAVNSHYTTRVVLHLRDSKEDVIGAASAAVDLIKNTQIHAIIGPRTSSQAEFIADIGNKTRVPIISFSATSPSLSPSRNPYFVRTAFNDSSQLPAIAAVIKSFAWREVVPIYEDTDYGSAFIPPLVDALQAVGARVPYRGVIPTSPSDDQIVIELYKLMMMQVRVFVLHATPSLGSRIFVKAFEIGMMSEGYVWITTDDITGSLNSLQPSVINAMEGVIGIRPYVPNSNKFQSFRSRWQARFKLQNPSMVESEEPTIFQLWAHDTAWALAMAAEKARISSPQFKKQQRDDSDNSTDLTELGISETGPTLLDAIRNTRFDGVAGSFQLVDGQLLSSTFEVVNVIGKGERTVGYWTPAIGLSRDLNSHINAASTFANTVKLRNIIWPGDSMVAPKGWVIPTNGKKLQIGVPVKNGFNGFVNVEWDSTTNATTITGYCIDIFDEVMRALPYAVPYEYVPFNNSQHQPAGSYDNLVYQVFIEHFDAVVGDVTIVSNRSNYIDFTLPFTESGVSMVVPVKADDNKNAWIFLYPLTTDLWLGSLAFFFFTGFMVWLIEHRINEEFRGPPLQQLGLIFYFAFSTLVFAHKEKLESNLSRLAVIIWVFVVLILTSSYTASLTSMLTVLKLRPTVKDLSDIQKNGDYIGYQDGSFVVDILHEMKFDKTKLVNLSTPDQYADALSRGSRNGGVAAIFDELPYLKLFLSEHCSDYTMVGRTYKTGGFGFVFPRGSLLVSDVSRAVLNVTEGERMPAIERKWFGDPTTCPEQSDNFSSTRLGFRSFGGLFLITGVISLLSIIVFFAKFIYKERKELVGDASESSLLRRIVGWAKHYDKKDLSSHTFKREKTMITVKDRGTVVPIAEDPQSPLSIPDSFNTMNFDPPEQYTIDINRSDEVMETPFEETSIEMGELRGGH